MPRLIAEVFDELLKAQGEFEKTHDVEKQMKVIEGYTSLLDERPDDWLVLFQLATCYLQLQKYGLALNLFKRAIWFTPDNAQVWSNLGCAYRSLHMIPEARDAFMKSLGFNEAAETLNNMAACYINEDDPEKGIPYAVRAMELQPDEAKPKWNYGLIQLELQNWAEGFKHYDAGFFCNERQFRNYSNETPDTVPFWKGEEVKTLVVWDEQGLGDRILNANLLRKLEGKCDVILECHPRLENIYKRSFPWVKKFYPTAKSEFIDWPKNETLDAKISSASLPSLFWRNGLFDRTPYIKPNPERVKYYRDKLESLGKGPYIGFSWHGGAPKTNTAYRSLKLKEFKPLIETGGTWVSLQYHDWAAPKIEKFRSETNLPVYHFDEATLAEDYDEALSLAAACDLVVTVCTTMVHLCGAAGIPVWIMVPKQRAWRYPNVKIFPWYGDHAVQYHQKVNGKWDDVIQDVIKDLKAR